MRTRPLLHNARVDDDGRPFDWDPGGRGNDGHEAVFATRLRARIRRDAPTSPVSRSSVAPLCDLSLIPIGQYDSRCDELEGVWIDRPGRASGSTVLPRGTALEFVCGHGDPYHEVDLLEYRALDGPLAGSTVWLGEGRVGWPQVIAGMLLALVDAPVLRDPDAGDRLLVELRQLTRDMLTASVARRQIALAAEREALVHYDAPLLPSPIPRGLPGRWRRS